MNKGGQKRHSGSKRPLPERDGELPSLTERDAIVPARDDDSTDRHDPFAIFREWASLDDAEGYASL